MKAIINDYSDWSEPGLYVCKFLKYDGDYLVFEDKYNKGIQTFSVIKHRVNPLHLVKIGQCYVFKSLFYDNTYRNMQLIYNINEGKMIKSYKLV